MTAPDFDRTAQEWVDEEDQGWLSALLRSAYEQGRQHEVSEVGDLYVALELAYRALTRLSACRPHQVTEEMLCQVSDALGPIELARRARCLRGNVRA